MNKTTLYGKEAREKILEGVHKITNAIKVTLGSNGRNVIIAQAAIIDYNFRNFPLHVTKDGWTVARCFDVENPVERVGVMMIKEVCTKTVDMAGDGTTTSAVLAEAIVEKGIELINNGSNPMELKKGIDKAVEYVVDELKKMAIPIGDDNEKIFQIATVSANNDTVIGRFIADAFTKIGNEGIIYIEESAGVNTEIKTTDGFKIDSGWEGISPLFVTNNEKQICEFENPLILLYQNRITHHTQFEKALPVAMQTGRPILIVCEDAAEEGLAVLVRNNFEGRIKCCVIKSPYLGDAKREAMEDLAVATGGYYISDNKGIGIKDVDKLAYFGQAKKVIVSKYETEVISGNYKKEQFEELVNDLRMNKAQAKGEDEKNAIEKRIARLTGGVAVIYVGATTKTEMKEKKDRVEDAVRATKAAIAEGYVIGGGAAFLKIGSLDLLKGELENNQSYLQGITIVFESILSPIKQICKNAGVEYQLKIDEIIREIPNLNIGYNAKDDKIENLIESGIIDPVKVLRCALQNAASSAGTILTAECMIVDTL